MNAPNPSKSLLSLLLILLTACTARPAPTTGLPAAAALQVSLTATSPVVTFTPTPLPSTPIPAATTDTATKATAAVVAALTSPPASPAVTPTLPAEYYIRDIRGHKQYFTLGCEAATAKDWANYFGYDFNEFEFQYALPLSDNPDFGFVGDVNAPWGQVPPYGYGVHAQPIADLLNSYGIPAKAHKNYTLDQIIAKLAQDKPVIAWVIGNVVGGVPAEYTDKAGRKVTVAAYEHVVILTGYNEIKLRYMTNGKFFETPKDVFLNSWGVLGNMVVVDE